MTDGKDNKIRELEEENKTLKKQLDKLRKEFEEIKREFEEYKSMHAATVLNLKEALHIKPNSHRKSSPLGAPKNHEGYARHIPERVDHIKELNLKKCPYCNTLLGETQEIRPRYVTDIKLLSEAKTTRYDIHRKYCPHCKKIIEPKVKNALPHARLGLNLMLLVMYLKLGLRLSCQKIVEYFMDMHDLKISEAEIIVILRQLVVAFGEYYSYLEKLVKAARIKHSDTTGWRIHGKNYFAWVFIACGVVLYKIRKRNNHKAALCFLGKQQGKILVVDRHAAFRTLAEKAGFLLQLCWSHILQDSKELAEIFGAEGAYVHRKLKDIFAAAKSLCHKGTAEMVEQLKSEIFLLTIRHYKHSQVRKFVNSLYYRDADNLFRFVTSPEIDATNNLSERELRALVIMRKISNGSRSTRGANATAMLLSVVQTLRLNKENVLQGLQGILKNPSGY